MIIICSQQEGKPGTGSPLRAYDNEPDETTPLVDSLTTSFSEDDKVNNESCFDSIKKTGQFVWFTEPV